MVERFFFLSTKQQIEKEKECSNSQMMLLSGPPSCGKTSLLFQFAFNSAYSSSAHRHVVFICNRRRLESKPPYLSQGIDASSDVFNRIRMKYVEDYEGINKYLAGFHLHQLGTYPTAVVIDDFGDFFDDKNCKERLGNPRGRDLAMVRTLALCRDAIAHANESSASGEPCRLLLSDTHHGDTPRLLFIYKRWIPSIFTVEGDGSGSFILTSSGSAPESGSTRNRKRFAKFSTALQYLVLQEITEETEQ
ncbi:PREDICTED: uncharacterized protein LOC104589374 [Nelumbo nucifera]|nr:PREDICTED: uncharacterized protein LOC104589374 [Nelumbo nucifera]